MDQVIGQLGRCMAEYKWGIAGSIPKRRRGEDSTISVLQRISSACSPSVRERMNQSLTTNLPSMIRAMYVVQFCVSQQSYMDDMSMDNVPGQYEASCFFAANKLRSCHAPSRCAGGNSLNMGWQCVTINDPKRGGFAARTIGKTSLCVKCMASATCYPDCQGKNCTMARILAGVPNIIDIINNRICTSMTKRAPFNVLREATSSGYHRHRNISSHGQPVPPGSVTADERSRNTAHSTRIIAYYCIKCLPSQGMVTLLVSFFSAALKSSWVHLR